MSRVLIYMYLNSDYTLCLIPCCHFDDTLKFWRPIEMELIHLLWDLMEYHSFTSPVELTGFVTCYEQSSQEAMTYTKMFHFGKISNRFGGYGD